MQPCSAGAFMRLCDMGVEPFLVSSTVEGVLAQRLVRRLCPECCEEDSPPRADLPGDFPWDEWRDSGRSIFRAVGCKACRGVGYRGRIGLYEIDMLGNFQGIWLANRLGTPPTPPGTVLVDTDSMHHDIVALPPGTGELVCHPGRLGAELLAAPTRLKHSREAELSALCDAAVRRAAQAHGIEIVAYRDL